MTTRSSFLGALGLGVGMLALRWTHQPGRPTPEGWVTIWSAGHVAQEGAPAHWDTWSLIRSAVRGRRLTIPAGSKPVAGITIRQFVRITTEATTLRIVL